MTMEDLVQTVRWDLVCIVNDDSELHQADQSFRAGILANGVLYEITEKIQVLEKSPENLNLQAF